MTLAEGTRVGRYEICSLIGAGGMGEVYLAQDTSELGRFAALKILPHDVAKDKDRLQRFAQEARAVSNLNHPNILTVYEFGQTNAASFIATEYIDGTTLRECLSSRRLKLVDALDLTIQIVAALNAAHEAGVTHRDLKPENVMVRRDQIVKVLDFGLAKLTEPSPSAGGLTERDTNEDAATKVLRTEPGTVMGTVAYMSPEQSAGMGVDHRTDIWSVGVVLYEMICSSLPFQAKDVHRQIIAIQEAEAPPLSQQVEGVPDRLEEIVNKCLAKDRNERYQTARDLLIDLRNLRRKLDVEAEIERTVAPAYRSASGDASAIRPGSPSDAGTGVAPPHTTSSVEYIITGINQHKRGVVASLLIGFLAMLGLGYWFSILRATNARQIDSIAVMPFVNENGNEDVEYLSDGMTETLIGSLSQLPKLNVKARSSVFRYKGKDTSPQTIGKELNVQAILNGRVVQRGDRLTLSLELIDAQSENVIWSDRYDRKQTDLLSLQSEIARDVSSKLKLKLSGADQQKLTRNYTSDPEVYRLYLQGRFYWNKRTKSEVEKAVVFFKQAVERDPNFALGYVGLADSFEDIDRPTRKEYIRRALDIDDNLAEAHASLGYQYMLDYNWSASERELKRAMELNPNYAQAYQWNGARLMMIGKYDEALASIRRALEIDPTANGINFYHGVCLAVSGKRDEAVLQFKKTIEMDPTFPWAHSFLSRVYAWTGDYAAAVEERAKAVELDGRPEDAKLLRDSFAAGGWQAFLRDSGRQAAFSIAALGSVSGLDKETAIKRLMERAERGDFWLFLIKIDPAFDALRGDPRFQEILKKFDPPR